MKQPFAFILAFLSLLSALTGCSSSEPNPGDPPAAETEIFETFAAEATHPLPFPSETAAADISVRLKEQETAAAQLHSRLTNDQSLNQADMNDLSYEIYRLWDDLLNEIWQQLPNVLSEAEMAQLTEAEREWIRQKEDAIKQAAAAYGEGSLAALSANQRGAALTRERVYFLAGLLTGQEIPAPAEFNRLYPSTNLSTLVQELFLPLAEGWHILDYDVFLSSALSLGFSVKEAEGFFEIPDPDEPGSYLFGSLTTESGSFQIAQLGYCRVTASGERSIRVDFAEDSQQYFICAVFWDDGTPVDSLREMVEYLFQ